MKGEVRTLKTRGWWWMSRNRTSAGSGGGLHECQPEGGVTEENFKD